MHEQLQQWMINSPDISKSSEIIDINMELQRPGIRIERLIDETSGNEAIKLYVDPLDNNWYETEIGSIQVEPIETTDTRNGKRRSIKVNFQNAPELLPYRSGEYFPDAKRAREIPIDENGVGWGELGRGNVDKGNILLKGKIQPKPWSKWIIVDTNTEQFIKAESQQLRAVAD